MWRRPEAAEVPQERRETEGTEAAAASTARAEILPQRAYRAVLAQKGLLQ